jgi:hypothetical protein
MRDASGGLRRGSHVVEGKRRHGLGDAQLYRDMPQQWKCKAATVGGEATEKRGGGDGRRGGLWWVCGDGHPRVDGQMGIGEGGC